MTVILIEPEIDSPSHAGRALIWLQSDTCSDSLSKCSKLT